ncbi:MAG: FAD-dependent oxidoreductase [Minicystis sp.]
MKKIDVVIIGGGISGLTTAYNLLKQEVGGACPFHVTILEAEPETGGQARAFEIDGVTVEHGSHVFFNYYKNIIDMIEELRADPRYGAEIPAFERIPGWTIVDPYGRRAILKHSPNLPTMLAVLPSILQIPWLSLLERFQLAWGALRIILTPFSEFKRLDDLTSFELAKEMGYSDVGALTWNSASLGLTNLFVQEQSGAIFGGKHHLLINTPDGLAYRLPAGNLTKMFAAPMTRWVEDHGGTVLRGAAVKRIGREHGEKRTQIAYVRGGEEHEIEAAHVVVATTPRSAAAMLPWVKAPWTELEPVTPVITMVLQLSGKLDQSEDGSELGLSREYWTFSVLTDLSKFWPEFSAEKTGNKTVLRCEIGHANLLAKGIDADEEELVRMVKMDIDRLYPHAAEMKVEWAKLHRESKHLYTKWVKGAFQKKPEDRDCGQGVFLAGDWTTKGTIGMEAAANSGIEAANHIIVAEKLPAIVYIDVPLEG